MIGLSPAGYILHAFLLDVAWLYLGMLAGLCGPFVRVSVPAGGLTRQLINRGQMSH